MGQGRGREEEEGGREGGKAAGRARVTEIWQGGRDPILYSTSCFIPSKHISASPAHLSQPSYPVALPLTFDISFDAVHCFKPDNESIWKRAYWKGVETGGKTCKLSDYETFKETKEIYCCYFSQGARAEDFLLVRRGTLATRLWLAAMHHNMKLNLCQ